MAPLVASPALRRLPMAALLAAATSVALNLVLYFAARLSTGVELVVQLGEATPPVPLPVLDVVCASSVPVIPAALLLAALQHFAPHRAVRWFSATAVGFLLFTVGGPLAGTTGTTQLVLLGMHLIAALALCGVLLLRTRS